MIRVNPPCNPRDKLILVAEDDPDDRLVLELVFRDNCKGCELRFVKDGEELLDYLLHRNTLAIATSPMPDLILLDLNMPEKDGRESLLEIKSHENLKDVPVVVWTTSSLEEDKVFCKEAGASDYVTKPADFHEMSAAILRIVKKWL